MRALHAEQRPRSIAQEKSGIFSAAVIPWPQAGQRERGTNRLYVSGFGWGGGAGELPVCASSAHCSSQSRSIIFGKRWMTTLRNEPTASPSVRHSQGNTAGWAAVLRMSLIGSNKKGCGPTATLSEKCKAARRPSDRLADLEDRQVHRDHHSTDQDA